jgi:hypothetical protein
MGFEMEKGALPSTLPALAGAIATAPEECVK